VRGPVQSALVLCRRLCSLVSRLWIDRPGGQLAGFTTGKAQLTDNIRTFPLRLAGARGPGINCWQMSVFKAFRIAERAQFQLRAEGQDALNHPLFSAPNTNPNNTNFGQITSTTEAAQRSITLGARMLW
jgi:hypothetical protein